MPERQQITDDEFDRLAALYDALYRVLTPAHRRLFFGSLCPPPDDEPRLFAASVPLESMPYPANDRYG